MSLPTYRPLIGLSVWLLLALAAPSAWADDPAGPIEEIAPPTPDAQLLGISTAPDGTIWFTEDGPDQIGHYDPGSGQFREYPVKTKGGELWGILQDSTGTVWYTSWFLDGLRGLLGRLDPATGEVQEYEIPGDRPWAFSILEYQGGIWLPLLSGNAVVRFDPRSETFEQHPLPEENQGPAYLTVGPDGDLWVSLSYVGRIARLDPDSGRYDLLKPGPLEAPVGLLWAADGSLWIGDHGASRITRYDPRTGRYELFPTSQSFFYPLTLPNDLAQDSQGRLWFIQHGGNRMAYYDPGRDVLVEIPIPTDEVNAQWMTLDGQERPWFAEYTTGKLGTVDPGVSPALEVQPEEDALQVSAGSSEEVRLPIRGSCGPGTSQVTFTSSTTYLSSGRYGGGLEASFEPAFFQGCPGEFGTTLILRPELDIEPGNYRLRVGVSDGTLVLSRYVELNVTAGPVESLLRRGRDLIEERPLVVPALAVLLSLALLTLAWRRLRSLQTGRER